MTTRPYLEQEESEAVNLRYYFDLIFRQRVPIVPFLIIIVTVAVLVVLKLPNNYQAVAELLFDNPEAVSAPERELATPNYGQDHIATQLQILKGISVTEEAVKKTNYHEKVGMSMERAAGSALGALSTIQIKGTRIVRVVFQSEDPKIAAEMVNAICEGYIKKNIENRLYFSQEIMKLLPAETQKTLKSQTPMGQLEELSQKELIEDISLLRRDILDFLRSIRPHEIILESIHKLGERFFEEDFSNFATELSSRHRRLLLLIENQKDTLETLYATNDSLLTHRSNEIIKTLTMMALLTFPLTLIAAIFSLNTKFLPIVGRPNDFWIILGIMLATVLVMLTFFKYRKWI